MTTSPNTKTKSGALALLLSIISFNNLPGQPAPSTNGPPTPGPLVSPAYAPGEVLVKFRTDVTQDEIAQAFWGASLQMLKQIQTRVMRENGDRGITRAATAVPVEQAVAILSRLPGVAYAEPNLIYRHQALANDPYFTGGLLWGMYGNSSTPSNPFGSQAAEAWGAGYTGSSSVVVGIIDEGFEFAHPDLSGNVWTNPFDPPDGIDNDGNGYIDDIHGWNFYGHNNSVYDGTGDDHGTHVAGTIGAMGNNGQGVVGINWAVSMISGKFIGPNGGLLSDAVEAVDYFTDLRHRGVNIVALNNSWVGGYSQGLQDAFIRAAKADILVVAAAGNGDSYGNAVDNDSVPIYPACFNTTIGTSTESAASYDAVIAVTAIDSSGNKASWANYGATTVDLGAPGVNINSTLPVDTYGAASGTSMSTPHVTGAIALYASTHPAASAQQIKSAILASTVPIASLSGKTVTGGRLDLSTVITPPAPPTAAPTAPSGLAATVMSWSEIQLTWTDNSATEDHFEITRTDALGSTVIKVPANSTVYTDFALKPNTAYAYSISACNSMGCTAGTGTAQGTTPPKPAPATATFIGTDTATQGNWVGKYGGNGYNIITYNSAPSFGTVTPAGYSLYTWANSTTDTRALQTPSGGSSRFAACWYSQDSQGYFNFDVNVTDSKTHRISLYCLDWDSTVRQQAIEIDDRNYGNSIATLSLSSFQYGKYVTWDITGPVIIKLKWIAGANAVVSGIFFDPVPNTPPTVSIISPTGGATFASGAPIAFSGSASDAQDGVLSSSLVWTSSLDGQIGTGQSFSLTSLSVGTHIITASVTDSGGATASASVTITVTSSASAITLTATGYQSKGRQKADLRWTGATSPQVDVYRNGKYLVTTANNGQYTDNIGKAVGGSYTYRVCQAGGTSLCSNDATVNF